MTAGFTSQPVPSLGGAWWCPNCRQQAVRFPVEAQRLDPPPSHLPAFALVEVMNCINCGVRHTRFRVATVNAPAVSERWKATYFYREGDEPAEPRACFVMRQECFPGLPRAWGVEEMHTAAGIVHRNIFGAQPIDLSKRLRKTAQERLLALWPLVLAFWEVPLSPPPKAPRALAEASGGDHTSVLGHAERRARFG
jgi:hypothetical protein